jgi:hypothetical protein
MELNDIQIDNAIIFLDLESYALALTMIVVYMKAE